MTLLGLSLGILVLVAAGIVHSFQRFRRHVPSLIITLVPNILLGACAVLLVLVGSKTVAKVLLFMAISLVLWGASLVYAYSLRPAKPPTVPDQDGNPEEDQPKELEAPVVDTPPHAPSPPESNSEPIKP